MKNIVKGNDFTMRIPVRKMVDGDMKTFPLPACTDIAVRLVNAYKYIDLTWQIAVKDDSMLLATVNGTALPLGKFALEVKGRLFDAAWRSCEYEQLNIVDNNAMADSDMTTNDEGENSVEMDTAIIIQAPMITEEMVIKKIEDNAVFAKGYNGRGAFIKGWMLPIYANHMGYKGLSVGSDCWPKGDYSISGGFKSRALYDHSIALGYQVHARGYGSVALGYNVDIGSDGGCIVGRDAIAGDNVIFAVGGGKTNGPRFTEITVGKSLGSEIGWDHSDKKFGYKYLVGVGGYQGYFNDEDNSLSVQEVIADLTKRIEALELQARQSVTISNVRLMSDEPTEEV